MSLNNPIIGIHLSNNSNSPAESILVHVIKYLTYAKYDFTMLSENIKEERINIGYYRFVSNVGRILYLKLISDKKNSIIFIERGLNIARTTPLHLMSENTIIFKVVERQNIKRAMHSNRFISIFHESVHKNKPLIPSDVLPPPALEEYDYRRLGGSPTAGLLAASMLSGLSRHAYELHSAAAQDLISAYLLNINGEVGARAVAAGLSALYTDLLIYFVPNILSFKYGGTIGGELAQSIAADLLRILGKAIGKRILERDLDGYISDIASIAKKNIKVIESSIHKNLSNIKNKVYIKNYESIRNGLENVKRDLIEFESKFNIIFNDYLNLNVAFAKDGTEPLIGRFINIMSNIGSLVKWSEDLGGSCDLLVTLTGQWSGNQLLLINSLLNDKNNKYRRKIYVIFTPYTIINLQHIYDVYQRYRGNIRQLLFIPVSSYDLKYNHYVGRKIGQRYMVSGKLCALIQGPIQITHPLAVGLYEGSDRSGNVRIVIS